MQEDSGKMKFANRVVLPSGIILLLKEVEALPSLYINLSIEAGSISDPEGMEGLSILCAESLLTGTKTRTAAQISQEIDFTGGSLTARGGKDCVTVSLNMLKKTLPAGLEMLSDVLNNPSFPDGEVARKKNEIKARIRKEEEDPGSLADKWFLCELFEGRSYGRPVLGSEKSISALSREDLVVFYKKRMSTSRIICSVVGQTNLEEFVPMMERYFQTWPVTGVEPMVETPAPATRKAGIKKVDRDITQANIVLGHEGVPRNHPDYYVLTVMNYALGGGGFRSRLVDTIREERGLAYSIYSLFVSRKYAGYFRASLETKNSSAGLAISQVLEELEKMKKNGLTSEELEEAKMYMTGSFPLKIDTNIKIANFLTDMEFFGLGLDYPFVYPKLIEAVTLDQACEAAGRHLHPESCTISIVGKQDEINWP